MSTRKSQPCTIKPGFLGAGAGGPRRIEALIEDNATLLLGGWRGYFDS